jgi:hypothetical protein
MRQRRSPEARGNECPATLRKINYAAESPHDSGGWRASVLLIDPGDGKPRRLMAGHVRIGSQWASPDYSHPFMQLEFWSVGWRAERSSIGEVGTVPYPCREMFLVFLFSALTPS